MPASARRPAASVCVTQPPRAHQVLLTTQYQQVQGVPKIPLNLSEMKKLGDLKNSE